MIKRHGYRRSWVLAGAALLLAALACDALGAATPTTTPGTTGEVTPTPSPLSPTDTPVPDVAGPGECALNAAWVADVTVPDNTTFPPGESFSKTWRVRNSGTCPWEPGTLLVYISGDPLGGPGSVPVAPTAPDSTTDISVNMVAPMAPGTYKGNWQMQAPEGTRFGSVIYVQIVVPGPPTETPPSPMCTPPACAPGEVLHCPGSCPGGCGVECVTPVPGPCVPVDPALASILTQAGTSGLDVGCPTAAASPISGAFQEFETNPDNPNPHARRRGYMIWRSDTPMIYALGLGGASYMPSHSGTRLHVFNDLWDEGQPEVHPNCVAMTPPTGYELPVRGFGKVWCENMLWAADQVGWPREREWGVSLLIQPTENGALIRVSDHPTGNLYLFALDFPAGKWVSTSSSP